MGLAPRLPAAEWMQACGTACAGMDLVVRRNKLPCVEHHGRARKHHSINLLEEAKPWRQQEDQRLAGEWGEPGRGAPGT